MEHKQWNFRMPGTPDGNRLTINTQEITSVYDLLDRLRKQELQHQQMEQEPRLKPQARAVVIPLLSRMLDKRRHPSA